MSPVIRWNHNLFALLFCILIVAICCRLKATPNAPQIQAQHQKAQTIRNKAIGDFVGGAIGVHEERGDSLTVVNYTRP